MNQYLINLLLGKEQQQDLILADVKANLEKIKSNIKFRDGRISYVYRAMVTDPLSAEEAVEHVKIYKKHLRESMPFIIDALNEMKVSLNLPGVLYVVPEVMIENIIRDFGDDIGKILTGEKYRQFLNDETTTTSAEEQEKGNLGARYVDAAMFFVVAPVADGKGDYFASMFPAFLPRMLEDVDGVPTYVANGEGTIEFGSE